MRTRQEIHAEFRTLVTKFLADNPGQCRSVADPHNDRCVLKVHPAGLHRGKNHERSWPFDDPKTSIDDSPEPEPRRFALAVVRILDELDALPAEPAEMAPKVAGPWYDADGSWFRPVYGSGSRAIEVDEREEDGLFRYRIPGGKWSDPYEERSDAIGYCDAELRRLGWTLWAPRPGEPVVYYPNGRQHRGYKGVVVDEPRNLGGTLVVNLTDMEKLYRNGERDYVTAASLSHIDPDAVGMQNRLWETGWRSAERT